MWSNSVTASLQHSLHRQSIVAPALKEAGESRVWRALPWISASVKSPYAAWLNGKRLCPAEVSLEMQHGQIMDDCVHSPDPQQGEKLLQALLQVLGRVQVPMVPAKDSSCFLPVKKGSDFPCSPMLGRYNHFFPGSWHFLLNDVPLLQVWAQASPGPCTTQQEAFCHLSYPVLLNS